MSSAWASATIQEFEQVTLENGTELFRVSARGPVSGDPGPRPLLVTGPGTPQLYEPRSSGGDRRGTLRLAYSVPSERVDSATTFALQLPDGERIELPSPTFGQSRAQARIGRRAEDAAPQTPAPVAAVSPDDSSRVRELATAAAERDQVRGELETTIAERDQARAALEIAIAERDRARAEADAAAAAHEETRGHLELACDERDAAHERATALAAERDEAIRRAEADRADREAAHEDARAARAERDVARAHAAEVQIERDDALRGAGMAQAERDGARRETEAAQAELDTTRQALSDAREEHGRALADAHAQRDAAAGELARTRSELQQALERAQAERDEAAAAAVAAQEAVGAARAERDAVLADTAASRAEHARLTSRLRQHEARFELLRADARRAEASSPGPGGRLRQLESEREQLAVHVRALSDLLSSHGQAGLLSGHGPAGAADRRSASNGSAERVAEIRERAVRAAHEQAERDLEHLLADSAT